MFIANVFGEVLSRDKKPLIHCFVDNGSLVDSLYSTKSVEDKHLRIDIAVLKDMLAQRQIHSVSWVQSSKQLANVLTKAGVSPSQLISAV